MNVKYTQISKDLINLLAEKIHITWMEEREMDGWVYGPDRNDSLKTSPCMLPYEQLPEEEKKYDQKIAETVILALLEGGYQITPDPCQTDNP